MSDVDLKSEHIPTNVAAGDIRPRKTGSREALKPRIRIVPVLITLATEWWRRCSAGRCGRSTWRRRGRATDASAPTP